MCTHCLSFWCLQTRSRLNHSAYKLGARSILVFGQCMMTRYDTIHLQTSPQPPSRCMTSLKYPVSPVHESPVGKKEKRRKRRETGQDQIPQIYHLPSFPLSSYPTPYRDQYTIDEHWTIYLTSATCSRASSTDSSIHALHQSPHQRKAPIQTEHILRMAQIRRFNLSAELIPSQSSAARHPRVRHFEQHVRLA